MFKHESRNVLLESVIANKGGSFTFDGEPVSFTSGYAVSLAGFETVTKVEGLSASSFVSLVNDMLKKVDGLADPTTHMVGTWINNGDLYIDLSVHVQDKEKAIVKAKAGSQLAIFDFASGESVTIEDAEVVS